MKNPPQTLAPLPQKPHHKCWSLFFLLVSIIIPTTMMAPHALGLQNFTQWGGMYTDGWCTVTLSSAPLKSPRETTPEEILTKQVQANTTRAVWYASMHNELTCLTWGRTHCGKTTADGWVALGAYPYFRQKFLFEEQNICDIPPDETLTWFPR